MSITIPYKNFSKFVLRTPLLSFTAYKELTSKDYISDHDFKGLCNDANIKEAIFLASPSLYASMEKWLNNELEDEKKEEKFKLSLLKYISRMSSRCTPFGLFAGCSVGRFAEETNIEKSPANQNKRHTRLDMNYLVALSQDLVKIETIKKQLLFYPNTSIYEVGDQLRYVEYKYINSKRHHRIIAVDSSNYLHKILSKARSGAKLSDFVKDLTDDGIQTVEALAFVEELVNEQILVSELEPSVSGPEFLEQILSVLRKLEGVSQIVTVLEEANLKMEAIDSAIGNDPKVYLELCTSLKELGTDFERKFMFQTDMVLNSPKNMLNKKILFDLQKGIALLNKITLPPQETFLSKFKSAFYERFEEREVPLSKALDTEIGLGYKPNQGHGDVNPLVDNLVVQREPARHSRANVSWTSINSLFQEKITQALIENSYTVNLTDAEFEDFPIFWDNLPDTMSYIIEVINFNGEEKIKFRGGGGSSASNLLGRFCHSDNKLYEYVQEIIDVETNINHDKLLAEIVHLPESRVGNILMRPSLRKYEIPYLANSLSKEEFQLPLDDLMVSVKNNRIFLRSKKHNKEVVPHLSNAHNYSNNSLPIYHFLSDMQTQDMRGGIGLDLGPFVDTYEFIPRIEYHNLILQYATWNIKKEDIEDVLKNQHDDLELKNGIKSLMDRLRIPQYVMLADGDNELLVNLDNLTSARMLLSLVKKRPGFKITEFLFDEDEIVKQAGLSFANQVIVSFYNEEKLNNRKNGQS